MFYTVLEIWHKRFGEVRRFVYFRYLANVSERTVCFEFMSLAQVLVCVLLS